MTALPVSVCIPVRNEEKNLPDCLKALQGAFDEVVVVDSGSTDGTKAIAKAAEATVLDFQWNGEFPKKRNWALLNHPFRNPWVLFLDADERITDAVIAELRELLPATSHSGFWLTFDNWFMGRPLKYGDPFHKLALFRTDAGLYERFPENSWSKLDMEVHEHPVLRGTAGQLRSRLQHYGYNGLTHYIAKHNEYSSWEANRYLWLKAAGPDAWQSLTRRQQFKYRNMGKWWLPWFYFLVSFVAKQGFRDGWSGWTFARLKMRYFDEIRLKILDAIRR